MGPWTPESEPLKGLNWVRVFRVSYEDRPNCWGKNGLEAQEGGAGVLPGWPRPHPGERSQGGEGVGRRPMGQVPVTVEWGQAL